MKLGFIGTGAITSAIVTGLKSETDNSVPVLLSPRNAAAAIGLASRYPEVSVAADNQAVLDNSNVVMLAVRPQIAREVLANLRFRPDHHVVSLIATLSREEIAALAAPVEHITKAIPIPPIAQRQGATVIFPSDPSMAELFGRLGKVIEVEESNEFDALSVVTATFAAYFKYLDTIQQWVQRHGVTDAKARDYIATVFKALASAPETKPRADFMQLAEEFATRGGLNEQVLQELTGRNVFDILAKSLDAVHQRISDRTSAQDIKA